MYQVAGSPVTVRLFVLFLLFHYAIDGQCRGAQSKPNTIFQVAKSFVVYGEGTAGGVALLKGGELLITFTKDSHIMTIRSGDNGLTWHDPQPVVDGAGTDIGITTLQDGTLLLPLFHEIRKDPCCAVRHEITFVYRSADGGVNWEGDAPISVEMREPIPYAKIVELPDGRLLLPVWGSYHLGERWQVGTFESTDHGKSWGRYSQIAYDPEAGCRPDNGFNENSIAQLPNHTLVVVIRQQRVGNRGGPCDHHTEPPDYLYRAVSHDLGKTWGHLEPIALMGAAPSLQALSDSTLMLAYMDPTPLKLETKVEEKWPHYGIAVGISTDEGATWIHQLYLKDPKGFQYTEVSQPGYPDLVELPNGDVLAVFSSPVVELGKAHFRIAANILQRIHESGLVAR